MKGYVAEGSGENFFVVRDGVVRTPPLMSILAGITRDSVIKILTDDGIEVRRAAFPARRSLYRRRGLHDRHRGRSYAGASNSTIGKIGEGKPGPITRKVIEIFHGALRGREPRYGTWLLLRLRRAAHREDGQAIDEVLDDRNAESS